MFKQVIVQILRVPEKPMALWSICMRAALPAATNPETGAIPKVIEAAESEAKFWFRIVRVKPDMGTVRAEFWYCREF